MNKPPDSPEPPLSYGDAANLFDFDKYDISAGQTKGLTLLQVLRKYPTARAKLLELVPELKRRPNTSVDWEPPASLWRSILDLAVVLGGAVLALSGVLYSCYLYFVKDNFSQALLLMIVSMLYMEISSKNK